MAVENKQTLFFFHGPNKFGKEKKKPQRIVHLFQIIFNFLFCLIPISYSTERLTTFFHLLPPICIQLPCSQTGLHSLPASPKAEPIPTCILKRASIMCVLLSVRLYESFHLNCLCWKYLEGNLILMFSGFGEKHLPRFRT